MDTQLLLKLTQLLRDWETLAGEAQERGEHDRYYLGVMLGLEAARADLGYVLAEAQRDLLEKSVLGQATLS